MSQVRHPLPVPSAVKRRELRAHAQRLRCAPTASEHALWQLVKAKRLGVTFRRQCVVGRYIVDCLCARLKLIVEVDGGYHEPRWRADARRDAVLAAAGYRVVRLSAELVLTQPQLAAAEVLVAVRERHG